MPFFLEKGRKPLDERLRIKIKSTQSTICLYSHKDDISIPSHHIKIGDNIFFEEDSSDLPRFQDIKKYLNQDEILAINIFLETR